MPARYNRSASKAEIIIPSFREKAAYILYSDREAAHFNPFHPPRFSAYTVCGAAVVEGVKIYSEHTTGCELDRYGAVL